MKKLLKILLLLICISIFCICSYKIYTYTKQEKETEKLNEELLDTAVQIVENDQVEKSLPITVDFTELKKINEDIVGWLYSENTPINYPVVQANNNSKYLRRLINGQYNESGTLFVDYRNNDTFEDYNTIIYGHNMKNNMMFGTIPNYDNQEYYEEHKIIYLFTEKKNYKIELFSGYVTSAEAEIYNFPKTETSNKRLIEYAKKQSNFETEVEVTENDKIITLSTCSYDYENARYVLFGVLREIDN